MEVTWLGHSCFKVRGRQVTLITDPYDGSIGYRWPAPTANLVTVSHSHPGHGYAAGVSGDPKVISRPGEYEISDVFIIGLANFHDSEQGARLGRNTAYLVEMEDVTLCHLGDLGHLPSSRQVQELSNTDVLFVPVGGVSTIGAEMAAELVRLLSPKIVIPMHYETEVVRWLEPLSKFVKEMGLREVVPQPRLSITRSNLPTETTVAVLAYPEF